jgi:hypothetical protein
MVNWSSLLLLVAVATAVACVPAVTGIPAVAGVTSSFIVGQVPLLASGNWHPVSMLHVSLLLLAFLLILAVLLLLMFLM